MANIRDNTAIIPFVLFGILAAIVAYAIIKGRPRYLSQAEQDKLYANI